MIDGFGQISVEMEEEAVDKKGPETEGGQVQVKES